jgi:transcription initiation factor TFIIIB Brf1 subunit/transcription initiation factor TFIIB
MSDSYNEEEILQYLIARKSQILDENTNTNVCIHQNIVLVDSFQETCMDCGLIINSVISEEQEWRYYGSGDTKYSSDPSRVQYRKEVEKGIIQELSKYDIGMDIKIKANFLYNQVTKNTIKRGRSRLAIIFACIFNSYIATGNSKTSEELREMFKLERREASRALTYFKMNHDSRSSLYISSYYFIPLILSKFNADETHENNIKKIYSILEKKDISKINGSNPKSISAGLVFYYLININKAIDPDVFAKLVGLSKITILKISKYIASVINNEDDA